VTRERARDLRSELERLLDDAAEGDIVVIDLQGIEAFDFSFANELFGKTLLALSEAHPGRLVVVENLTPYTRENLEKALEGLQLAVIERQAGRLSLLGRLHAADKVTFGAIAASREPLTASALKDALEVNLTAMNERLSKLSKMGLVWRRRSVSAAGREQYEYLVPA
jgi:hypothetical protein